MDSKGLRALLWVLVVSGCLIASLPGASIGAVASADAAGATLQEDEADELPESDEIHINVFLAENGSAVFEVNYRYHLENGDENETIDDWDEFADEIRSNEDAYTEDEVDDWSTMLDDAENETDRDMTIRNADLEVEESRAPRHIGHVTFTFEWTSFADVVMNQIEAGDAISGFPLTDGTTLQIFGPEDYVVYERDPSPNEVPADDPSTDEATDNSVFWSGDGTEFTDDQPRVVFIENGGASEEASDTDERLTTEWLAVLGALTLLAAAAAVGWLIRHRQGEQPPTSGGGAPAPVPDSAPAGDDDNGPPPELLSNEERVLRLLEDRGGRIKQQEVVSELDWTEAKTSQVVGRLRDDDEIDVFRIGRENVLALPDDDLEE